MDRTVPFVSVIVPVLNGERTIEECLVALLRMDYPAERREVLVVDNGSTDRSAEIIKRFPVGYITEARRGVAYARNRGIGASAAKFLAFTDQDCIVTAGWLRELVKGLENDEVGVVAGEVVAYPPKTSVERYVAVLRPVCQLGIINYPVSPWFLFANALLRREVFDRIGVFDVRFAGVGCEDIDFSWRFLQDNTFKLVYRPKAVIFHHHRVTSRGLFRQCFRNGQGQAVLRRKYPHEIGWDRKRELDAYMDLLRSTLGLVTAVVRAGFTAHKPSDCSYRYHALVRKLGQRMGFMYRTFRGESGHG